MGEPNEVPDYLIDEANAAERLREALQRAGQDFQRIQTLIEDDRKGVAASVAYDSWYRTAVALAEVNR